MRSHYYGISNWCGGTKVEDFPHRQVFSLRDCKFLCRNCSVVHFRVRSYCNVVQLKSSFMVVIHCCHSISYIIIANKLTYMLRLGTNCYCRWQKHFSMPFVSCNTCYSIYATHMSPIWINQSINQSISFHFISFSTNIIKIWTDINLQKAVEEAWKKRNACTKQAAFIKKKKVNKIYRHIKE